MAQPTAPKYIAEDESSQHPPENTSNDLPRLPRPPDKPVQPPNEPPTVEPRVECRYELRGRARRFRRRNSNDWSGRAEAGSTFGGDGGEGIQNGRTSHHRKRRMILQRRIEIPARWQKHDCEVESPESEGEG